jgi:hypothetical protein
MEYYLSYIKDVVGNNYLGIKIEKGLIDPYLVELKDILGSEYETYINLQQQRDRGSYHMTVINAMDFNRLSKEMGHEKFLSRLDEIFKTPIEDLQMWGVGTAQKNENRTFFVVCKSQTLTDIRNSFGLTEHDFHITLGFKWKDCFGVRKNEVLKKNSKFIQLLSQEYLKKENFEFLKKIENWEDNPDIEIIPISLRDDYFKIKVGDYLMDIGLTDDLKLRIFTRYKDELDVPRMSTTELLTILTKKDY